jgi:hypothetical protein
VHRTTSLDHGLDLIDDRLGLMVGNQLAQARVGEHHWLSFQMDTEGREISTRFACSHHFFTSDMSVDRNAVPIASEELSPHRTRSKYHIEQWLSEESPNVDHINEWTFIHWKAFSG